MTGHRYAALVGNGLSIPYNAKLSVPNLTNALLADLAMLSGNGLAGAALSAFANGIRGPAAPPGASTFERLLGPLEAAAAAIPHLSHLAGLTSSAGSVQQATTTVSDFARDVHRLGLGRVLDRIARESEARLADQSFIQTVQRWVECFHTLPGASTAKTIGTLNYDGLVHAAALSLRLGPADLSTGYDVGSHVVVSGSATLAAHKLRSTNNLPPADLQILNLHGSLGWLRDARGEIWKFELGDLRTNNYWTEFAAGESDWQPVVILTDQKTAAVAEHPFSLAYDIFRERLTQADRWMIVGYGLGDQPVNNVLRSAMGLKTEDARRDLMVLGIDYGKRAADMTREIAQYLGIDSAQVLVDVAGIPAAIQATSWTRWAA
ncbi:MAG: SIR2 family protein [Sandaracinaceae bacterium]|nr:SIR2 family protein [Sandaracinaceae bacterium]